MIVEPLELEILATLIKGKHEVRIVDMILEERNLSYFIDDFVPDVICITGYITHIPVMIQYCSTAKQINKEIITIVGEYMLKSFRKTLIMKT